MELLLSFEGNRDLADPVVDLVANANVFAAQLNPIVARPSRNFGDIPLGFTSAPAVFCVMFHPLSCMRIMYDGQDAGAAIESQIRSGFGTHAGRPG